MVHCKFSWLEHTLFSDAMCYICTQKVICHLIKLLNALYMGTHNSFLFFENSNVAIDLSIAELIIAEIPQSSWHLIFTLVVKQNMECPCVVIDFKLCSHGFFYTSKESTDQDDVIDGVTVELANVIRPRLRIHNHSNCDRSEHFRFAWLISTETLSATPVTS